MASFPNLRRFTEPSAHAEGTGTPETVASSDAARGTAFATLELATLQRNTAGAATLTRSGPIV